MSLIEPHLRASTTELLGLQPELMVESSSFLLGSCLRQAGKNYSLHRIQVTSHLQAESV